MGDSCKTSAIATKTINANDGCDDHDNGSLCDATVVLLFIVFRRCIACLRLFDMSYFNLLHSLLHFFLVSRFAMVEKF